jgi:uncharacterized protein YeaO (DUF488 family)
MLRKLCLLVFLCVLFGGYVCAQSIADAARQERERRAKMEKEEKKGEHKPGKPDGKVITERDLKSLGGNVTSSKSVPEPAAKDKEATVREVKPAEKVTDASGKDEAYWRSRKQQLEQELAAAEKKFKDLDDFLKKNHANYTLDSLAPIKEERERAAQRVEQVKQKLKDLEEEARKAGALPDWLR